MCIYFKDGESSLCNQPIDKDKNNTEDELLFEKQKRGDEACIYMLHKPLYKKCEIGLIHHYEMLNRNFSYSELIEFANAVNHAVKLMEANMKDE